MSAGVPAEMLAQNMTWMRRREAEKKATRRAMAKAEVEVDTIRWSLPFALGQETADGGVDDGRREGCEQEG